MIKIKNSSLATAAEKGMDEFLQVFIDAYLEAIGSELNEKTMPLLNGNQSFGKSCFDGNSWLFFI